MIKHFQLKIIFQLIIIFYLLGNSFSSAEPVLNESKQFYNIQGETVLDLRSQMDQKSDIRLDGLTYDAKTDWYVIWKYQYGSKQNLCTISKVETEVYVKFTLPKWINQKSADSKLINKWDNYFKALLEHEKGHEKIALRAASEIEKEILSMGPSKNCNLLSADANKIGEKILSKYKKIEIKYDIDTKHGASYGAQFQ